MPKREPKRTELYTVKELLNDPSFRKAIIMSTQETAIRLNSHFCLMSQCLVELLDEMKKIKILLKQQAGLTTHEETEEEREERVDLDVKKAKEEQKRKLKLKDNKK